MLIDPHIHTTEISKCSNISIFDAIDFKISLGYDGAVLVNHTQPWYYKKEEHKKEMQKHIDVFKKGLEYAKSKNFILMLGIEVTLTKPSYADYLIYGVTEEFLLNSPCLYDLTLEELYNYTHKYDALLIEAHPFRDGCNIQDPRFLDGVEINAQPRDDNNKDKVIEYAKLNHKLITCGCDFHGIHHPYRDGIIIDSIVKSSTDFKEVLRNKQYKIFYKNKIIEKISY